MTSYWLMPLLLGFTCNAASAFTTALTRRLGPRRGRVLTALLRNVLGIPSWVLGLGLAVRSPSPALFDGTAALTAAAWLLLGTGSLLQLVALSVLRAPAAVPSVQDQLVQRGPYRYVRHPIYLGLLLQFAAIVLVQPRTAVAWACALGMVWATLQARLEEADLLQRMPSYKDYMAHVGRFVPRLGRTGASGGTAA